MVLGFASGCVVFPPGVCVVMVKKACCYSVVDVCFGGVFFLSCFLVCVFVCVCWWLVVLCVLFVLYCDLFIVVFVLFCIVLCLFVLLFVYVLFVCCFCGLLWIVDVRWWGEFLHVMLFLVW